MTILLFANNAKSFLASAISSTATTATLASGTGSLFPSPTTGQGFKMTFVDAATGLLNEIVLVTARSGDTITIVRGQEGTTPQSWLANDLAGMYFTAGTINNNIQLDQYQIGTYDTAIATGSANALSATIPSNLNYIPTNFTFILQAAYANTGAATLNLTIGSTATGIYSIVKSNNQPLIAGDIANAGYPMLLSWSPVYSAYVLLNPGTGESTALSPAQLQEQFYTYAQATGGADTIAVTIPSSLTSLSDGLALEFRATGNNATTTPNLTLTLGSTVTATTTIVKGNNQPLAVSDIAGSGYVCQVVYSSSYGKWILLNPYWNVSSLGTMAFENSNSVNITGGTITGSYGLNAATATNSVTTSQTNFSNLFISGNQVLSSSNFNSYAPTLNGAGAYGNWGINITGNANTVNTLNYSQIISGLGYTPYNTSNPAGYVNVGLGFGGTQWNNVTGSRSFNTTYTNSKSYPIAVSATATCSVTSTIQAYVNGMLIAWYQWQFNGCGSYGGTFIIVPPGATYQLNSGQGVYNWVELY